MCGIRGLEPWAALSHWGATLRLCLWVLSQGWGQGHWLGPSESPPRSLLTDPKGGWSHIVTEKILALGQQAAHGHCVHCSRLVSTQVRGGGSQGAT